MIAVKVNDQISAKKKMPGEAVENSGLGKETLNSHLPQQHTPGDAQPHSSSSHGGHRAQTFCSSPSPTPCLSGSFQSLGPYKLPQSSFPDRVPNLPAHCCDFPAQGQGSLAWLEQRQRLGAGGATAGEWGCLVTSAPAACLIRMLRAS